MRVAGVLFHVVDVARDRVVLVDMADAVKLHLFLAGWATDTVAVDDPVEPLVKGGPAFGAADPDLDVLDFVGVGIHRNRLHP